MLQVSTISALRSKAEVRVLLQWMGVRAPQLLVEGPEYSNITISPQEMRTPGWITEGYFVWFTVKDAKGNMRFGQTRRSAFQMNLCTV